MFPNFEPITEASFYEAAKNRDSCRSFPVFGLDVVLSGGWYYVCQRLADTYYKTPAGDVSPWYIAAAIPLDKPL